MFKIQKAPTTKKAGGHFKSSGTERKSNYGSGTGTAFADMSIHYHSGHQTPVVQMIRKRVKGVAGAFTEEDIYYDKSAGEYYNNMNNAGHGEVTIQKEEHDEYQKIIRNKDRTAKTTILAEAKQGGVDKYAGNIEQTEGHAGEGNAAGADIVATADIFTVGQAVDPPKVVRLYAEGNMKHAASLARAFENPGKYSLFEELDADTAINNADNTTPEALVKATEFDDLTKLLNRYRGETRGNILNERTGARRLEASFGGFTGDMTREHQNQDQNEDQNHVVQPPRRLYDIIQATFFWIPDATNGENLNKLKDFMLNKKEKLKPEGKIRIILTNRNAQVYYDNIRNRTPQNIPNLRNCYRWVADQLVDDNDLKAGFDIKKIPFRASNAQGENVGQPDRQPNNQTYAGKLSELNMNSEHFAHTRTHGSIVVQSYGDLMIEAKKKPTVNT